MVIKICCSVLFLRVTPFNPTALFIYVDIYVYQCGNLPAVSFFATETVAESVEIFMSPSEA